MARDNVLSIDQGTTNTKVLVLNKLGQVVARASHPVSIEFPQPGWVEQDPRVLISTVRGGIDQCLEIVDPATIACIGISNQRESVILWDRATGEPCGPCVIWQCRRSAPFCATLRDRGLEATIHASTGLGLDPLFSASKARWLLEQIPNGFARAVNGELCLGTVDSWVLWNLTGGKVHACDSTNASRTLLLDLSKVEWSAEMLDIFGIPAAALPNINPSSCLFGETQSNGRLPAGIRITSLIGDSHAAMFSHAASTPEVMKATYGTGSSLMMPVPGRADGGRALSSTIAWSTPAHVQYALEGNITVTGGAVDWLSKFLSLDEGASGAASLAATCDDTGGVYLVPAFAGLGAPHWNDAARGALYGLTRGTTAAHVARAAIESIAYQVNDVFEAMSNISGRTPAALKADGGASRNDALMQFQADILGVPVVRNLSADLSAIGAAWLAGLAAGVWKDVTELDALPRSEDRFEPKMSALRRNDLLAGWRLALERTLHGAH